MYFLFFLFKDYLLMVKGKVIVLLQPFIKYLVRGKNNYLMHINIFYSYPLIFLYVGLYRLTFFIRIAHFF